MYVKACVLFMLCFVHIDDDTTRYNSTVRESVVRFRDVHWRKRVSNHSVPLGCLQATEISGAEISRRLSGMADLLIVIIVPICSDTHAHTVIRKYTHTHTRPPTLIHSSTLHP